MVLLQVTPIVAIAPLIIIWVKDPLAALVICATIVAIFPIISNTTPGRCAASTRALADLFQPVWRGPLAERWRGCASPALRRTSSPGLEYRAGWR